MEGTVVNPALEELRNSIRVGNYSYGRKKSGRTAKSEEHAVAMKAYELNLTEQYSQEVGDTFLSRTVLNYLSKFCQRDGVIKKYRTVTVKEERKFTIIRVG